MITFEGLQANLFQRLFPDASRETAETEARRLTAALQEPLGDTLWGYPVVVREVPFSPSGNARRVADAQKREEPDVLL